MGKLYANRFVRRGTIEKRKLYKRYRPVEKHNTAAWADIDNLKKMTKVTIPEELKVELAKEWVDENQK